MGNGFVGYLNSMNNATGDNINALAESQVLNKYYESIMVKRKLGTFIANKIKNGEHGCYIISGYAGDGKTSILVQILKELDVLNENEKLKIKDEKSIDGNIFSYVKDMSELPNSEKVNLLKESLQAPKNGESAILISNTGPLINTFVKLFASNDSEKRDEIEDKLLKQLDENNECQLEIDGLKFNLINIARIDNIGFVKEIIEKISNDNLWCECKGCKYESNCPVYFNKKCIEENKDRVISFVENYYIWLKEHDKRLTIRQIISQISFAITGNLSCEEISKRRNDEFSLFKYNFANLFFGYIGTGKVIEANQIRAINLIQDEQFDLISLDQDYKMFVKNDFSGFKGDLRNIIKDAWDKFTSNFYLKDYNFEENKSKQQEVRKAIRRFLLIYGLIEEEEIQIQEQLYGKIFSTYLNSSRKLLSKKDQNDILTMILNAISIKNIGIKMKNRCLYFPLKKDYGNIQNIFLLLAKADKKYFKIKQIHKNVEIEDTSEAYDIYLDTDNTEMFKLTLPVLVYFEDIINGRINTDINPALSYGLDRLNAMLVKRFREKEEDKIELILVTSNNNIKELILDLSDEDKIIFE